jgi:hypothetical protein
MLYEVFSSAGKIGCLQVPTAMESVLPQCIQSWNRQSLTASIR